MHTVSIRKLVGQGKRANDICGGIYLCATHIMYYVCSLVHFLSRPHRACASFHAHRYLFSLNGIFYLICSFIAIAFTLWSAFWMASTWCIANRFNFRSNFVIARFYLHVGGCALLLHFCLLLFCFMSRNCSIMSWSYAFKRCVWNISHELPTSHLFVFFFASASHFFFLLFFFVCSSEWCVREWHVRNKISWKIMHVDARIEKNEFESYHRRMHIYARIFIEVN